MKKALLAVMAVVIAAPAFAYMPLNDNMQMNVGSYRQLATQGMFYDEMDVISASPVTISEFVDDKNKLFTNWSNVRKDVGGQNTVLSYNAAAADKYFTFGMAGAPMMWMGWKSLRGGFIFQNCGSKAAFMNLDNDGTTGSGGGLDAEGIWEKTASSNDDNSADGSFDSAKTYKSDVKKSLNTTNTVWNMGASWTWFKSMTFGLGIERETNESLTTTGGKKTYAQTFFSDKGLVGAEAGWPTGTTAGDSASVTFINQEVDTNSDLVMNVLPQVQLKLGDVVTANVGIGVRKQNDYNPNSILPNAITLSGTDRKQLAGAAAGDPLYNDEVSAVRNPSNIACLDYNDFATGNYSGVANLNSAIYTPFNPATDDLAIVSFKDERPGTGLIMRLGAKLFFMEGALNISSVKQDVNCEIKSRDYASIKSYKTAAQRTAYSCDITNTDTKKGDATITAMDFAVKIKLLDNKDIRVAFAPGISNSVTAEKLASKSNTLTSMLYDDGLAANNPGAVAINVAPGDAAFDTVNTNDDGAGEGTYTQSTVSEFTEDNEETTTEFSLPVGMEVPISKKFTFRAGTCYTITRNEEIKKTTTKNVTQVDTATPAGGAVATRTTVSNPTNDVQKSTYWSESHLVTFTYGLQWDVNDYLTIATNAFLDTNPNATDNGAGGADNKASLFDLDTYRCLAIQAVVRF